MRNTPGANASAVCDDLHTWCSEGRQYLEQGDPLSACRAFVRLIAAGDERAAGELGPDGLRNLLLQAVSGLARCLPALEEAPNARRDALQALYQAFQTDVAYGPDGLAKEASFTLLRHAGIDERCELASRLRAELAATRDVTIAEHYWRLFLDLQALDPSSLEPALDQCRDAGYPELAAEKLLDLDRVGEALIRARKDLQTTAALLRFVDSPAARGQLPAVMALVEERLAQRFDPDLAGWLASRYAERGDLPRALDLRLKILRALPTDEDYEAVHELARRLGCWEKLQLQVDRALRGRRRG